MHIYSQRISHARNSFSLSESIHMLGVVLNAPHLPATARNAIRYLLTRRVLAQNGVKALLSSLLDQESHSGELLERYEQIAKLLCTPPRGMDKKVNMTLHRTG